MKKAFFGLMFMGISAVLIASSDTSAQGIGVGTPIGGAAVGPRGAYVGPGYGGVGVYGPGAGVNVGPGYSRAGYGYRNYGYGGHHHHHGLYGSRYGGCGCGGYTADYDDDCDD